MAYNPQADDALAFQSSALAAAADVVDSPDDDLETEDPLSNASATKPDHNAKKADRRERYVEGPRLVVAPLAYEDPDDMPHRLNGKRITPATRDRDRSLLLEHPALSRNASKKRK